MAVRKPALIVIIVAVAVMLTGFMVALGLSLDTMNTKGEDDPGTEEEPVGGDTILYGGWNWDGDLNEAEEPTFATWFEEIDALIIWFHATVTWEDEPANAGYINDPDFFQISATVGGDRKSYAQGNLIDSECQLRLYFEYGNNTPVSSNSLYVNIQLMDAGDQYPIVGPRALSIPDTMNHVTLEVEYAYRQDI